MIDQWISRVPALAERPDETMKRPSAVFQQSKVHRLRLRMANNLENYYQGQSGVHMGCGSFRIVVVVRFSPFH